MLDYEESRTEDIVHRLVTIAKLIRVVIIIASIFVFLSLFILLGMTSSKQTAAIMALIGGVGGYIIGKYIAALITVMIEWCAQMLVGVENGLNLLKNK
jgi:hypothetical protein